MPRPLLLLSLLLPLSLLLACSGSQSTDEDAADNAMESTDEAPTSQPTYADEMMDEHEGETPEATETATTAPDAGVDGRDQEYTLSDGTVVTGYFATSTDGEPTSGVVIVHEWWGLNDNIRRTADRIAAAGYNVLAIDAYMGSVAEDSDTAMALMQGAMETPERLVDHTASAAGWLEANTNSGSIAVMGFCFGGGVTLQSLIHAPDSFELGIVYYGRVVTDPELLGQIQDPMVGHFGIQDGGIAIDDVRAMGEALEELGADATIFEYDADHAFANPSGQRYQEEAAELSWERTMEALASM